MCATGIPRGVVEEAIALNIDLMPTFVDLAGGPAPGGADGTVAVARTLTIALSRYTVPDTYAHIYFLVLTVAF